MRYRLRHYTHYNYTKPVEQSYNQIRMLLRDVPNQRCLSRIVRIRPTPVYAKLHQDYFGNRVLYVEQDLRHHDARIFITQMVDVNETPLADAATSQPWDQLLENMNAQADEASRLQQLYRIASKAVQIPPAIRELTSPHFQAGRPVIEAAQALCTSIYEDFDFKPHATTVTTPVAEVLSKRQGVCQDFAHLMIAALRQRGIPARYVSGYIETLPPVGKPRLVGADASHAWVSVWCGDLGWQDFDPTNNQRPTVQHITTAWGRDYDDVIPLNGVIYGGGGGKTKLEVRVDVERQSKLAHLATAE